MREKDIKEALERMEMETEKLVRIEKDEQDQADRKQAQADIREVHTRFKIVQVMEYADGELEPCNGEHYPVRLNCIKGEGFMRYHLNRKIMEDFNRKHLKRGKTRKEGFKTLVSNRNYDVNLAKAYPRALM